MALTPDLQDLNDLHELQEELHGWLRNWGN